MSFNSPLLMNNKIGQSYAPFGSVSRKNPKKKKNNLAIPGPGSYEVSLPMITPIVQTIKKGNNNIIVKLGHIGTAPFLAGDERFKQIKNKYSLGPGQYQSIQIDKNSLINPRKKDRSYAAEKIRQMIKSPLEKSPSITEIKHVAFQEDFEMPGIGQKIYKKQKLENIKGLNWSRMSQERFSRPDNFNHLGPGTYQIPAIKRKDRSVSSAFNSNSIRSFFDQIIFETNQDAKARQREQRKYKSDLVGPGSYQIQNKKAEKLHKFQFFGSTQQRI